MPRPELKATVMRGYVQWLRDNGLFDAVVARLDEGQQRLARQPPAAMQWLDAGTTTLPLVGALAAQTSLATVRRMSREVSTGPILKVVRPIIEGILRFAGGPRGVVARLPLAFASSTRHIELETTLASEDSRTGGQAQLVIRSRGIVETPASAEAWAGAIEAILALAVTSAAVDVKSITNEGGASEIRLQLRW